ncbi:GcrA-like cell cycle regulator protein [Rhizobium phage RHph_X2_24]|nr:GcrA-like cell cycle regulator protein [Rhizobium phage RHph_X2_24]
MIDRIKQEYQPGDTLRTLAARIGVSRSAISGYYNRNPELRDTHPVQGRNPGIRNTRKDDSVRARRERGELPFRSVPQIPLERPQPPAQPVAERVGPYTLLTLPSGCCKWPYGDSRQGGYTFCGEPMDRASKRPYCAEHVHASKSHEQRAREAAQPRKRRSKWEFRYEGK